MERQLDAGAAALLPPALDALGVDVAARAPDRGDHRQRPRDGLRFAERRRARRRPRRGLDRDPPETALARAGRPRGPSAASSSTTRCARRGPTSSRSASAPSTPASSTASSRRSSSRRSVAAATLAGARPARTPARSRAPSSRSPGIDLVAIGAADGDAEAVAADAARASTASSWYATARGRRDPARRHPRRRGAARRGPARRGGRGPARAARRGRRGRARPTCPTTRRSATATASARATSSPRSPTTGCAYAARGDGADPRRHRLRLLQGDGDRPRRARRRRRRRRRARLPVPVQAPDARGARRRDPRAGPRSRSARCAAACGTGRDCGACKPALAYLVSEINANRHREERDARFINDRVHANIQNDGTFSRRPAHVRRRHHARRAAPHRRRRREVRGAAWSRSPAASGSTCSASRKQDLPAIWRELGMPSGHAYAKAVRTVKTCVGCGLLPLRPRRLDRARRSRWRRRGRASTRRQRSSPASRAARATAPRRRSRTSASSRSRAAGRCGSAARPAATCARPTSSRPSSAARRGAARRDRRSCSTTARTPTTRSARTTSSRASGSSEIREVVLDEASRRRAARALPASPRPRSSDPWLERDDPYHPRQFTDLDGADDARASPARPQEAPDEPSDACRVDDVPLGEGRAVTLAAAASRSSAPPTGWYALDHACPHLGGPLADGIVARLLRHLPAARAPLRPRHRRRRSAPASPAWRCTASRCAATRCSSPWLSPWPSRPEAAFSPSYCLQCPP